MKFYEEDSGLKTVCTIVEQTKFEVRNRGTVERRNRIQLNAVR